MGDPNVFIDYFGLNAYKGKKYIKNGGKIGEVDASISKTFLVKGTAHERIDIEFIKGKAFVPETGGGVCPG